MTDARHEGSAVRRQVLRPLAAGLFILLVAMPLAGAAIISNFKFRPAPGFLEIEMRPTGGTAAQLFWSSTWAFSHDQSTVLRLHTRPGEFERLRFPLPTRPLEFLRFDALDGPGEVVIRRMQVVDREGRTIRLIDPTLMTGLHQIASIMREGQDVRVVTTPAANDPMLLLRAQWLLPAPAWYSLQFVTPFSLTWIALATFALIAVAAVLILRDVAAGPFGTVQVLCLAALFLTVVAAKLTLLRHYPMPVPFWDQWDGELSPLYLPFANEGLTWRQMFTLHNEHRIFFTRVLVLVLLSVNGQWDPHLQIVANILLHAATAVILSSVLWLAAGRRGLGWIVVAVGLATAPPFALENTLSGFQSGFYFLVLFSVLAIWLLGEHRVGSPAWLVGWFCAFCTIFTVAGGLLSIVAVAVVVISKTLASPRGWRVATLQAGALVLVAVAGYLATSAPLQAHQYLAAGTFQAFRVALERGLAFPWVLTPRACVVLWLPVLLMGASVVLRRFRSSRFEQYVLALAAWVALQAAAVAYSRGANGAVPASRYLDMLSLGFVVNTMALLFLTSDTPRSGLLARVGRSVIVIWLVAGAIGIVRLSEGTLAREGRERRGWMRDYVRNVRQFIVTDDAPGLLAMKGPADIPYHTASTLTGWLRNPYVRSILPATIRQPLAIAPRPGTQHGFQQRASATEPVPPWDSLEGQEDSPAGRFESEAVRCTSFPYLRFEVVGGLGEPGLRLGLIEVASGRHTALRPASGSRGWRSLSVRCPGGHFTIVAEDTSGRSSFGFRPPTELAWASRLAEGMIQRSSGYATSAALLVLLAVGCGARPHLRRKERLLR